MTTKDSSLGTTGDYSVQEERRPATPSERFYIVKGWGKVPQGWSFGTRAEAERKATELNAKAHQAHDVLQQRYVDGPHPRADNTYSAGVSHGPKDSVQRAGFVSEAEAKKWCDKMLRKLARQSLVKDDEIVAVGAKAHDSLSFTTLFWAGIIAALISKHYGGQKETVGMGSYDLRNYQPAKKAWDAAGKWTGGGSDWSYWLDGLKCASAWMDLPKGASAWMDRDVWVGMGEGGTRKKFRTLEEAKKYAESVAPANLARIRREMAR